jgi:hypothetical protein
MVGGDVPPLDPLTSFTYLLPRQRFRLPPKVCETGFDDPNRRLRRPGRRSAHFDLIAVLFTILIRIRYKATEPVLCRPVLTQK